MPKVSIIIPVYNSCETIERTISSCLSQTYSDFEIIVIDDGSTDKTKSVIDGIKDYRIKYYYFENSGRSVARNRGLQYAQGEFIQFLDSDDTLKIDKIEKGMTIFKKQPHLDAVQCGTEYYKGQSLITQIKAINIKNLNKALIRMNPFPIHSLIFKREKAHIFPPQLDYCEDWYFWTKTLYDSKMFFQENYYGANVTIHDNNTMNNYRKVLLGEFYILLKLKKEIKLHSLRRDIKIIKQYLNYSIKYSESELYNLKLSPVEVLPLIKYISKLINIKGINNVLFILVTFKNRILKKEEIY
ncbi:glycosyltransferase family 2 protein [Priestia megaterium]|uniref:glycosyltransferase family 2 protein n=1 Tax=Priestia megaterium TaxID=1404 RepID=UPI0021AC1184|nr:glycosyltransferase family 2 protein [Priestia megaterium]MCR8929537.1 glycosyltransferase family 2 protein [Priestia megaterium]